MSGRGTYNKGGRPILILKSRRCLRCYDCEPVSAGYCSACYQRINRQKHKNETCATPNCPRKVCQRGFCYICVKNNPNPTPRKKRKKPLNKIGSTTSGDGAQAQFISPIMSFLNMNPANYKPFNPNVGDIPLSACLIAHGNSCLGQPPKEPG